MEYGAIDDSPATFNSPNFSAASVSSALSILDSVTKQKENTVVSFSKLNTQNNEDLDAAAPVLLSIAKLFGNYFFLCIFIRL